MADNLTTILCRCHEVWEPSWNPLGRSRPVTGLLYLMCISWYTRSIAGAVQSMNNIQFEVLLLAPLELLFYVYISVYCF